ncbi:MAG: hypothetical protein E6J01_09440 [Chloroflexi bacterium]|nr:MAG: hypothetical protein E6J01_09440 [Chloroflexota bacterium]
MMAPTRSDWWWELMPPGAIRIDVPRSRPGRRRLPERLRELARGEQVVLCDPSPGSPRRCRRLADAAGLEIDREYLLLPSIHAPAYLVQDRPAALSYLWSAVLAVPPGRARSALLIDLGLRLTRRFAAWTLVGRAAPRVVLARRP